jgi:hypothetical protein
VVSLGNIGTVGEKERKIRREKEEKQKREKTGGQERKMEQKRPNQIKFQQN